MLSESPPLYSIDAPRLAAALDHLASQPLPETSQVFPWLHGLHPDNRFQLAFFAKRKRSARRAPRFWRGITLIKVGGQLGTAKLKGAVAPSEVLDPSTGSSFLEVDPREGFSVRNFQIQTAKMATLSDIVIYGDENVSRSDVLAVAKGFALAQADLMVKNDDPRPPLFSTFVLSS